MTISTQTRKRIAAGDGITTAFNFTFQVRSAADLEVYYTDTAGVITGPLSSSLYSVSLNAVPTGQLWSNGGSVTYPLSGSAIASGTKLTIVRNVSLLQSTSFINQGNYYPQSVERSVDLLTMEMQQVLEIANRALVLPIDSASGGALPNPVAGYALGWDSTGTYITNLAAVGSVALPLSVAQGGTGGITAAAARTSLGAMPVTGGTMTGSLTLQLNTDDAFGAQLTTYKNTASPAASDQSGLWRSIGTNSIGNNVVYGYIINVMTDVNSGTEDGRWDFWTAVAGTTALRVSMGQGIFSANATSGDMGVDTANFGAFYVNGARVPDVASTQAQMEAAASNTVAATPGSMKWHPGMPKAWIRFNGTGTAALTEAYNATLTDNGTGNYTVNITSPMAGTTYCAVCYGDTAINASNGVRWIQVVSIAAGAFRLLCTATDGATPEDWEYVTVLIFGDMP